MKTNRRDMVKLIGVGGAGLAMGASCSMVSLHPALVDDVGSDAVGAPEDQLHQVVPEGDGQDMFGAHIGRVEQAQRAEPIDEGLHVQARRS